MSNVLEKICETKRAHVARRKKMHGEAELLNDAKRLPPPRPFCGALKQKQALKQIGLIAEIKKASPSRGVIREDFHPAALAVAYETAGATCLSVLTDAPYFQGEDAFVTAVHHASLLPILRKDFMLDPYQIIESRALGADCILLIMAALSDAQAAELEAAAMQLGMSVLVEVHDRDELERALRLPAANPQRLIGINNRNLKTLEVDLATTEALVPLIPAASLAVCESGIATPIDISRMQRAGVYCFLVGESLMQQADVCHATQKLLGTR